MADQATLRIIDANFNRAREALRVAEDYARFGLESTRLTESLKTLRHRLREALDALGLPPDVLLSARDTPGDVGTGLSAAPELERKDAADVARAAFKRLEEALRSLEEYGKTINADAARGFEAIRYGAYELELQMFRLPRGRLAEARLYVIVTRSAAGGNDLVAIARAVLRGGADALQLREKDASDREVLALAKELRETTRESGALLIINDRPDIALLADADGVHLGQDDLPIRAARRLLGRDKIIGATANTVEQAAAAEAEGADYIGCGAMFPTETKPEREVVGPSRLTEVAKAVRIPVFAVGGIGVGRLDELLEAGCKRVAVCSAIVAAENPEEAARAFRQKLRDASNA